MAMLENLHLPGTPATSIPGREPRMSAIDYLRLEQYREEARANSALPELKRCAVAAVAEEEQSLAIECEDLLGYSVLRQARNLPGLLARALSKLEIEFLDPHTVERYKLAMMNREAERPGRKARLANKSAKRDSRTTVARVR